MDKGARLSDSTLDTLDTTNPYRRAQNPLQTTNLEFRWRRY